MSLQTLRKQPSEVHDADVRFDKYFSDDATQGDYIVSAVVTVEPAGLVLGPTPRPIYSIIPGPIDGIAAHAVKVWYGGGTSGVSYKITVLATTNAGRIEEEDFTVRVQAV